MVVKCIGSQRARMIWETWILATLDELACAGMEHRLCRLPGIGGTLEAEVLSELERMRIAPQKVPRHWVQLPLFPSNVDPELPV